MNKLYSSNRHYITLTYDGNTAGGYLWLTFICEYKNTENSYKKRLKIPKGQSEAVNRRRTENTMAKENEQVQQPWFTFEGCPLETKTISIPDYIERCWGGSDINAVPF